MTQRAPAIRGIEYPIDKVVLRLHSEPGGNDGLLTFDLFADSRDLSLAGFAINAMTIAGSGLHSLAHQVFELDEEDEDRYNEWRESVICEPGSVLEISHLRLVFGADRAETIDVELRAQCFRVDPDTDEVAETAIPIMGHFHAMLAT